MSSPETPDTGKPSFRWSAHEIVFRVVAPPAALPLTSDELAVVVESAASAWNEVGAQTEAPVIRLGQPAAVRKSMQDRLSTVLVVDGRWQVDEHEGLLPTPDRPADARTRLYPVTAPGQPEDGLLDEADIEVNAKRFVPMDRAKLRAVLAHEMGHALGLDHSCGVPPQRSCATREARASIMYPDPLEAGRDLVLGPNAEDVATLARSYAGNHPDIPGPREVSLPAGLGLGAIAIGLWLWRKRAR